MPAEQDVLEMSAQDVLEICEDGAEDAAVHLEDGYDIDVSIPNIESSKELFEPRFSVGFITKLPFIERPPMGATSDFYTFNINKEEDTGNKLELEDLTVKIDYNDDVYTNADWGRLMAHEMAHISNMENNPRLNVASNLHGWEKVEEDIRWEKANIIEEASGIFLQRCYEQDLEPGETPKFYIDDESPEELRLDKSREMYRRGEELAQEYGSMVLTDPLEVYKEEMGQGLTEEEIIELFDV